jgi:hypothetical protein
LGDSPCLWLRNFELATITERSLSLNLDVGLIAHLFRASTRDGADEQSASFPSGIVYPKLVGPVFEPAQDPDAPLVRVLVGDARS